MDENEQKQQLSIAYLHAVASAAGFACQATTVDNDSVDRTLVARGWLHDKAMFRSPKIDVQLPICGKEESVASVQLDFLSAERFELEFAASAGSRRRPWVIHRAPLGSHERFVAMLLEKHHNELASTLTTEGHNDDPYGPGIVLGAPLCSSMYATRLYVVPRSIPTTLPMIPLRHSATII